MSLSRFVISIGHRLVVTLLALALGWAGTEGSSTRAAEIYGASVNGAGIESYERAEIWHGNRRVRLATKKADVHKSAVNSDAPDPREAKAELTTRPMWTVKPSDDFQQADSRKRVAEDMLSEARRRVGQGEFKRARQLVRWARDLSVLWNADDFSPEDVADELERRASEQAIRDDTRRIGSRVNPLRTSSSLDVDMRPIAPSPSGKNYDKRLRNLKARGLTHFGSHHALSPSAPLEDTPRIAQSDRSQRPRNLVVEAETSNNSTLLSPLVSFLAGVVCLLFVLVVGLAFVLRRFKAGGGSIFRVEVMSHPTVGRGADDVMINPKPPEAGQDQAPGTISFPIPAPTSTFADKRQQQQRQLEQQEQALLKHVFEMNVELYGELSEANRKAG